MLLLDEPSSGIAQREAEALGPLLLRIRAMTGASLLIIEHDVPLLTSIADRMIALDLGEVVTVGTPSRGHDAIPGSLRPTWENPKQSSLAAVLAASCPDRGKHMAASSGGAANGGGSPNGGGASSGGAGKMLRRYGPILLVIIVIVGVIAYRRQSAATTTTTSTRPDHQRATARATCP